MTDRSLGLGLFLYPNGHHIAAWRDPDVDAGNAADLHYYAGLAEQAELAGFDFLFIADSNGMPEVEMGTLQRLANRYITQPEPIALLSALAARTDRIGLIGTASTTYNEPYQLARRFASLDHLSQGRAGWNIVTSIADAEARNFGRDKHPDHAMRYARATEFAEVVQGLWDSWEPGAFLYDKAAAQVFDPDKLHVLNHKGPHFSVEGPINLPAMPQGHPILFQAGASDEGLAFAARFADVIFATQNTIDAARTFRTSMHERARLAGRPDGVPLVFAGLTTFTADTEAKAQEKLARLDALIHPDVLRYEASRALGGTDVSGLDLDQPIPDIEFHTNRSKGLLKLMLETGRSKGLTLRELAVAFAGGRGNARFVGTGATVADQIEEWYSTGAVDGFNLMPATYPLGLQDFVADVVPELQLRGLMHAELPQRLTLRQRLRLPAPRARKSA